MATLNIGGRRVTVDDSFMQLSPEQQNATVEEIASSFGAPQASSATPSFAERFGSTQLEPPSQQGAGTNIALDFMNQGAAAGQGTTPNIQAQMPNLISDDTHQDELGNLLYRDPQSGQLVPTDENKQVAFRDPADNRIKVFARTPETDEGRLSSAGRLLGTGMAAGAPVARPALAAPTVAQATPKASDVFATAKPGYRAFTQEASQIDVPAETAVGMAERLRGAIARIGIDEDMAGAAAKSALRKLEGGQVQSLDELQRIKRTVGYGFKSPDKAVRDGAGVMSAEISKIISEVAPTAGANLRQADEIHATATALQDLQRKGDVANLRTGRAGYGGNAVNAMRQTLSPIVQKSIEGKKTAFKPNEIAAMREIVEGTTATNLARGVGQLSLSKGILQTIGTAGATLTTAATVGMGPAVAVAAAIPAIGAASNKLATVLTGRQIDRLKELVAKRSPAYAEAVKKSVDRYEKAQIGFASNPTSAKLGAYVSASRQLSNGLSRDGISITSGDLMRALQLGGPGKADEEQ